MLSTALAFASPVMPSTLRLLWSDWPLNPQEPPSMGTQPRSRHLMTTLFFLWASSNISIKSKSPSQHSLFNTLCTAERDLLKSIILSTFCYRWKRKKKPHLAYWVCLKWSIRVSSFHVCVDGIQSAQQTALHLKKEWWDRAIFFFLSALSRPDKVN